MKKLISILLALALLATCITALAETEGEEFICREENFSVRIPAGTSARFEEDTGLVIYTRSEGKIPYAFVSRRPLDMKFKNPENFLNNVVREHLENKYGRKFQGMNPAKTWEIGGKSLLGARYMYLVGDTLVTQLWLVEIRDGGDVEYSAKYTESTEEITMAALNMAVQSYRETDTEAPAAPEATEAPQAPDVATGSGEAPAFLVPSQFAARFNATIEALADQYVNSLGEDGVQIVKEYFTFVDQDFQNPVYYYDTKDGHFEAAFIFADGTQADASAPALSMNLSIRNDTPDVAVSFAKWILEMMILYEYQDEVSAEELDNWFESAKDPGDIFSIPGYTLNVIEMQDYVHYAVLSTSAEIPAGSTAEPSGDDVQGSDDLQGNTEKPVVWDDSEWADFHCEEDGFTTKKPYHALTQYKNDRGYMGMTFYLDIPGYPPYVLIHRRPLEGKFKNPENYLNNTYREFLEDKYANASVGTSPARIWEIGGKQLIGAKYFIKDQYSETTQIQLIEIRELGDVEYTVMFDRAEDEASVMKALEAAVANYIEDEAQAAAKPEAKADNTPDSDDYSDDDGWDQETAAAWAEERKAAKQFTAGFSAKLTDRDLLTFNMLYDNGYSYVLGKTTPKDMMEQGWNLQMQGDGAILLYDRQNEDTGVILTTEHGYLDEPILTMNAFWEVNLEVDYCGFDGAIGVYADDPDEYWYPDETGRKIYRLLLETGERLDVWDGLVNWLVTDYGARQSEEGIYEAKITLSDGRTLYVSSHDSQVRISLVGFE